MFLSVVNTFAIQPALIEHRNNNTVELICVRNMPEYASHASCSWRYILSFIYRSAEASYKQTLAINENLLGKEHPLVAKVEKHCMHVCSVIIPCTWMSDFHWLVLISFDQSTINENSVLFRKPLSNYNAQFVTWIVFCLGTWMFGICKEKTE